MGFDIHLRWAAPADDPRQRNRELADMLLRRFPELAEFAIDHQVVAELLEVPASEVLQHWPQVELDAENGAMLGAIITLWQEHAHIELPSVPRVTCAEALEVIQPLLGALEAAGLVIDEKESLLQEYEAQRARVLYVAKLVGGTP